MPDSTIKNTIKRLHILPDEKIINRTIETFECVFPGENKYIILTKNGKCQYVDRKSINTISAVYDTPEFWEAVGDVSKFESLIIHLMTQNAVSFINSIDHKNIYWIEWGVDLYDILLEPKGYQMYFNDKIMYRFAYSTFKRRFAHLYLKKFLPRKDRLKAIKKVKYFVPDSMYDEYPLLLKYYPQFKHLQYREFFYYPINQVINKTISDKFCSGNNIIVGNSGSFTGNHFEIIEILSNIELGDRKVKFPLNYGGSVEYRNQVSKIGQYKLRHRYLELTKFVPLEEYNQFLLDASYFIYNNYRQEAVGNILVALYFGGKVFLSDNSPLLAFYTRLGIKIFKVSDLSENTLNTPLDKTSIHQNRSIIEKYYSLDRLYQLVRQNF